MKLEIHLLQSFPPANLNRDENGMPKSTQFGGRPRARISSQCQKRATRLYYRDHAGLDAKHVALRSRSWLPEMIEALTARGITTELADPIARHVLTVLGAKFEGEALESKTILFLGRTEIDSLAALVQESRAEIEVGMTGKTKVLPEAFKKGIEKLLIQQAKPGDIALFGRMMASLPTINVDASVQVAHALSVNVLQQEFDFFTAVDDLQASDDAGADHMGETGFNSACFYRYACLDTVQLERNLGVHANEAPRIAKAFVEAFIKAVPSGHQNGFAAHTLPSLVLMVTRQGQPFSLVDAFEHPIRPGEGRSMLEQAVRRLDGHWEEVQAMYGAEDLVAVRACVRQSLQGHLNALGRSLVSTLDELVETQVAASFVVPVAR
jgi:CRISPR system Cascade subunit CasC